MYSHMLIATDGSELADKAVAHGVALAHRLGARVTVLTVSEVWPSIDMGPMSHHADQALIDEFEKAATRSALAILAKAGEAAKAAGVPFDGVHVPAKRPAEAIVETARSEGCDLIVMASHGRRGLRRVLLGSQTVEALSASEVPVLVVR